jgi:hypothetical protein
LKGEIPNPKFTLIHSFVESLALSSGQQRSLAYASGGDSLQIFVIEWKRLRPVLRLLLVLLFSLLTKNPNFHREGLLYYMIAWHCLLINRGGRGENQDHQKS